MARISIPPAHRDALIALTRLPASDVKAITAALDDSPSTIDAMTAVVERYVDAPEPAVEAIVSLSLVASTSRFSSEELAEDVANELGETDGGTNIAPLLDSEPVVRLAKAIDLRSAHERLLLQARVLTDIRVVFPKALPDRPEQIDTAIVSHVLHTTYYANGHNHEMSFALRGGDLEDLRDQIARAIEKDRLVRGFFALNGGTIIDDQGDH